MGNRFKYVNLPAELVSAVKEYIEKQGNYTSVASFIQEAVRLRLEQLTKQC